MNAYPNEKVVNVYPSRPITSVNPPIRSAVYGVRRTADEIRSFIVERAMVEEVLDDGTVVPLDFSNYDRDNTGNAAKEEPKVEPIKEEEPKVEEVVAEEEEVVETVDPEENESAEPNKQQFHNKHNKHNRK